VQTHLQRVEVEAVRGRDHDLAIQHASHRKPTDERVVQFWKVPVKRPQIAALDVHVIRTAKDDCTKSIPLRLVEKGTAGRKFGRELRQHWLDRRWDRE
jgi:hypothetical protein